MQNCLQIKSVKDHRLDNRMESFFLAETTKYLYLMFDRDSFIHSTGGSGDVVNTPSGHCVLDAGKLRHLASLAVIVLSSISVFSISA